MKRTPYFFEFSGEHPTLPGAEALSCLHAECDDFTLGIQGPGYMVAELGSDHIDPIVQRIALTHRIGGYLGSCLPEEYERFCPSVEVPEGTMAVRVKRYRESFPEVEANRFGSKIGGILAKGRKVDLENPEVEVRVFLSDRAHFFVSEREIDRSSFERRKVAERPFFSPISLHPRYARALVNLTRVKKGQRLLDPFCGTGGILIEAASIGARAIGSDISPEMVEGCSKNLAHFDLEFEKICVSDIGAIADVFGKVDVIATDPPYGRSATTKREPVLELHSRALVSSSEAIRAGGACGIVFPSPCIEYPADLILRETYQQKVHRSLTRNYCIFTKR